MTVRYHCGDEGRRNAVRGSTTLNGIDFLEVSQDQLTLFVHFLNSPAPAGITAASVVIEGGVRITGVHPQNVTYNGDILEISVNTSGDFSIYTLRLLGVVGLDPRLSAVRFSFKVDCPSDFDCGAEGECLPQQVAEPDLNYLAKDYASFRRLMLDRLSALAPDWRERNPADLGNALVELMAYVGDQLSYYQDAVATEAYLGTARKRVSVRRHARLVDYQMHEGCNARAWMQFEVGGNITLPEGTRILTQKSDQPVVIAPSGAGGVLAENPVVFETMDEVNLFEGFHELHFYTWSDQECCLPSGATEATLVGPLPDLSVGDVLIFEEILGPKTGEEADADPKHRHVIRLTRVHEDTDPLNSQAVVEIAWDPADALSFPLCISARTDAGHEAQFIDSVSIARANIVLADHGQWLRDDLDNILKEPIGNMPAEKFFRPFLHRGPLTHAVPLPNDIHQSVAVDLMQFDPQEASPGVYLQVPATGELWQSRRDLLASDKFSAEFVVEMEEDGRAHLRFGDDVHGKRPAAGTAFMASYRIGNGSAGNVGAESLGRVITPETDIVKVRNPLPANGGQNPEKLEEVRQFAPQAFRVQQRAVTEEDYANVVERHLEVQRAAATFRWTGSWYTVFVSVDRLGGLPMDTDFERRMREHLNYYRMAGYDLEIAGPQFVPLEIAMTVCVKSEYFRSQIKVGLLQKFSNGILVDGSRGFFHPDNWTFGQPVYLSQIYVAANSVDGIESVEINADDNATRFQRFGKTPNQEIGNGFITIDRFEIARLDNDPNFPENGSIRFNMLGGK